MTKSNKKILAYLAIAIIAVAIFGYIGFQIGGYFEKQHKETTKNDTVCIVKYDNTSINALRKENKELYEQIKKLKGAESAVQIRYKYIYCTDTIKEAEFVYGEDSIYHFECNNDTVKTEVDVKAKSLDWCFFTTEFNGKFTIINQEDGDGTTTTIIHDNNVEIVGEPTVWHRKTSFKEAFTVGPTFGVGYGLINKKPDVYIGVSVGYNLLSIKSKKRH